MLNYNCINFHSSLLPKNRGADPILFSAAKKDSFGVTIHIINEKLDDGEYLYQDKVNLSKFDNLKKAYHKHEMKSLVGLKKIYPAIKKDIFLHGKIKLRNIPKRIKGSFFTINEAIKFRKFLTSGWNTTIKDVRKIYLKNKLKI